MTARDYLSPAFNGLAEDFFDDDTDLGEAELSDDNDDIAILCGPGGDEDRSRTVHQRRRATESDESLSPLPAFPPRNSAGRVDNDTSHRGKRPSPEQARRPASSYRERVKRHRRVPANDSDDSVSPQPVRRGSDLVYDARVEHDDSENSLKSFVCDDNEILLENGKWVEAESVQPGRRRRRGGRKKEERRKKANGHSVHDSDDSDDSDDEVTRKDEDGAEETEWVVERILKKRKRNGVDQYFIKWKHFSHDDNTWEPIGNLEHCPLVLKEFEQKLKRMAAAGRPTDDVEVSEDDGAADDVKADDVEFTKMSTVLNGVLEKANIIELESKVPDDLPEGILKNLQPREWITDFLIDDVITHLLTLYNLHDQVVYLPHHFFSDVLKTVENPGLYPHNSVLEYLWYHNAGFANVILVCASTSAGGTDKEAEHFALGVIVKFGEKIVLLDSVKERGSSPRINIFKSLKIILETSRLLMGLGKCEGPEYIYSRDCPDQNNNFDCGLYVILNAVMMFTRRQITRDTITSRLMRRFVYTLMIQEKVQPVGHPPMKRVEAPNDQLIGRAKRKAAEIAKECEISIGRKNTNAMIQNFKLLNRQL